MKHEKSHLEEIQEWQDNQFNPGYYVGNGKIPPYIKAKGNPGLMAIVCIIAGLGFTAMAISGLIVNRRDFVESIGSWTIWDVIGSAVFLCFAILFFLAARHYLKRNKYNETAKMKYKQNHIHAHKRQNH